MLVKMLQQSGELDRLPLPDQTIYMKLANVFETSTEYLFLNPEELLEYTEIGTTEKWQAFLNIQTVKDFVKGQMSFLAQVAQRKTFRSLVEQALSGNQSAAKQVQELSGILNQQDSNRIVVLHQIPRPIKQEVTSNGTI
jgi:hypothetical protein